MEPIIEPPHQEDLRIAKEERRQSSTVYEQNQKQKDDGGPVYPSEQGHIPNGTWNQTYESGISRRDWLAGLAMQGLLSNPERIESFVEEASCAAYRLADAMINESNKIAD